MKHPTTSVFAVLLTCLVLGSELRSQTYQAWVDPTFGNNATGIVQVPGGPAGPLPPFLTIAGAQAAIAAAAATPPNPALSALNSGLVQCMPGIYAVATNGEPLPIVMVDFISLQGVAGARATVVLGQQTTAYAGPGIVPGFPGVFVPAPPTGLRNRLLEVLVEGSFLVDLVPEMIDGFTFRGGNIQAYIETELVSKAWTISNCVFDMLNNPRDNPGALGPVPGPTVGVQQVSVFAGPPFPGGYANIQTNFFNNTVVMGWQGGPDIAPATALPVPGSVGFLDVNDPLTAYGGVFGVDPNPLLRGVNAAHIQNNVIRTLPQGVPATSAAFLGVDAGDTSIIGISPLAPVGGGTVIGPTNAFDFRLIGGVVLNALGVPVLSSAIAGPFPPPVPLIDVNPRNVGVTTAATLLAIDPGFVGEFINRTGVPAPSVDANLRDWRLLPTSAYVDLGTAPVLLASPPFAAGTLGLIAANGAIFLQPVAVNALLNSFDWDGEGPGNLRIVPNPVTPAIPVFGPDLGFDEANAFIATRSHANDSIAHDVVATNNAYPAGVAAGQPNRTLIFPNQGTFTVFLLTVPVPFLAPGPPPPAIPFLPWPSFSQVPPLVLPGLPVALQPLAAVHLIPLPPPVGAPLPIFASGPYFAPFDAAAGNPPHNFGVFGGPTPTPPIPQYVCYQFVWTDIVTGFPFITNTQSEIY